MKRILTIFAALLVLLAAFTSCSTSNTAGLGISRERGTMSFRILQTLDEGEALAYPASGSILDVVKIVSWGSGLAAEIWGLPLGTEKTVPRQQTAKSVPQRSPRSEKC